MYSQNRIQLTGNIARLAECREVGESTVTRARLMHNDVIHKADGETTERLVAVDLEIWGKRGSAFAEHISTKDPVAVEGKLMLDEWEAEDGSPRSKLYVRVDDWQFLAPPTEESAPHRERSSAPSNRHKNQGSNWQGKSQRRGQVESARPRSRSSKGRAMA